MKCSREKKSLKITAMTSAVSFAFSLLAHAQNTPEERSQKIVKNLKTFDANSWESFLGQSSRDPYDILRGDTLYGVSARMFGDPSGWPKIWELNNDKIYNPHMIYPGQKVFFTSGDASHLPSIQFDQPASDAALTQNAPTPIRVARSQAKDGAGPVYDDRTPRRSNDWKSLPRQRWEQVSVQLPPNVDAQGFDKNNYVKVKRNLGFDRTTYLSCGPLNPVAKIQSARPNVMGLSTQHEVTLQSLGVTLKTGKGYHIVGEPHYLDSKHTPQSSKIYPIQGKLRVLGVNDGVYLADILNHRDLVTRGQYVIESIPRYIPSQPIPGPKDKIVKSTVYSDPFESTFMSAAQKTVYLRVGSDDGVQPGMIFRMFQNEDPSREGKILTAAQVLVAGDILVTQVCNDIAMGEVLWSQQEIYPDTQAVALSDVNDYYSRYYLNGNYLPLNLGKELFVPEGVAPTMPAPVEAPVETPSETLVPIDLPQEASPEPLPPVQNIEPVEELPDLNEETKVDATPAPATEPPPPPMDSAPTAPEKPIENNLVPNTAPPVPQASPQTGEPLPELEADWLDRLDNGQRLGEQERRELEQLEKYQDNKPALPAPSTTTSPSLDVPYTEPQGEDRYVPESTEAE